MASTSRASFLQAIKGHDPQSTAIIHYPSGRRFSYGSLVADVFEEQKRLQEHAANGTLSGERIAFLIENSYDYVVALLSVIGSGAIALPLSPAFPNSELHYVLENSRAKALLCSEKYRSKGEELLKQDFESQPSLRILEKRTQAARPPSQEHTNSIEVQGGLMLYTSGTTSRPKGVVLAESVLNAQARSLHTAWNYSPSDHLLHVLPLHHIHGTVNALLVPLLAGSTIEFLFPFNAQSVWQRFAAPFLPQPNPSSPLPEKISFFTAVPTIWSRLLSSFSDLSSETQSAAQEAISLTNLRLNISGSASLPTPIKQAWADLSRGNVLLERFGMTEVGMALSCGLDFRDRVDGSVGWPLPDVEARLVDPESGAPIAEPSPAADSGESEGEIQLRGPTVFSEYWDNPEATAKEFVEAEDRGPPWFKTGDVAVCRYVAGAGESNQEWAKGPMFFIKGRKSTDIIKTGGEKVSALEIERELLSLPQIAEATVVGVSSESWGQKVAAVVVLKQGQEQTGRGGKPWGVMDMRRALKDRLVNYKVPQELKVVESLPRNAMGKVNKKDLVKEMFQQGT